MGILFTISMFIAHPSNNLNFSARIFFLLIVGIVIVIDFAHFVFSCRPLTKFNQGWYKVLIIYDFNAAKPYGKFQI